MFLNYLGERPGSEIVKAKLSAKVSAEQTVGETDLYTAYFCGVNTEHSQKDSS